MEKIKLNNYYFFNILIIITINLKFIETIKVFCGPAIGGSSNPCQSPLLQRPGLTLTEELMDGQKVCCGFDKKINGYLPDGKKEDSSLRKRPKGSKLICKNAITIPISNGNIVPKCPPKLFYDSNKDKCCRYQKKKNKLKKDYSKCKDLSAPGKPSDCPANKHRCNETIWYKLMTEQCPKTCNRCEEYIKLNISRDVRVCRDGIGPNGVSECPQNKHRCEDKIWKDFMEKECPETCGYCGKVAF
uniref:ShKT domain-containing protein n=1 Tax=Meloidogyne javanica TaxID=6303 RepID=A0A915MBP4_MELJA